MNDCVDKSTNPKTCYHTIYVDCVCLNIISHIREVLWNSGVVNAIDYRYRIEFTTQRNIAILRTKKKVKFRPSQ